MSLSDSKTKPAPGAIEPNRINTLVKDWLNAHLLRPDIHVESVEITPAIARAILEHNPDNRLVSETNVRRLAHDIKNDKWEFNGETIVIASDGSLNDGQHRLWAIIEADRPVRTMIVFGVTRESRTTLDQGIQRRVSDFLTMKGVKNSTKIAAVANYVWAWQNHGVLELSSNARATKQDILGMIVELEESLYYSAMKTQVRGVGAIVSQSLLGFIHWAVSRRAPISDADTFVQKIANGVDLEQGNPILYARNRLIETSKTMKSNDKAELLFRAWNAYRRGDRKVRSLPIIGGELPKLEP